MRHLATHLAINLSNKGVQRYDKLVIMAPHSTAQVVGLLAASLLDAVFVIINPLMKEAQVKHQIYESDAKGIIATKVFLQKNRSAYQDRKMAIVEVDEWGHSAISAGDPAPEISPQNIPADISNIIFTSGSTGQPKGVVLPHRTLLDGARIVSEYLSITSSDSLLGILPLNFDYGLNQLLTCIHNGARYVIHNYRMPQDLLSLLDDEMITGMAAVPTIWPHLLNPRMIENKPSLSKLRYITTAGGPHKIELLRQLAGFFPATEIYIMYGLTESFRSTYLPPTELLKRPGCIGKPVPEVEILVLDEEGNRCAPGEKGELIHRGAFVSYGYLNEPILTRNKFIDLNTAGHGCLSEKAVRSGDIVSMDEEGYIYFHGRADSQMKCGGYRVSPTEVEDAILSCPHISHAAAFPLPDPQMGQVVGVAYVVYSGQNVEESTIRSRCIETLPSYAVPRYFKAYSSLPLTNNGKVDYCNISDTAKRDLDIE